MKTLIQTKRDELEQFIREQMEGPNGCNGSFTKSTEVPFDEEVINTTPGSIYSTAVLFPKKTLTSEESLYAVSLQKVEDTSDNLNANNTDDEDNETQTDNNERNGSLGSDVDEDDVYSLNRRFPNTIGISCCLQHGVDIRKDVNITISGRYYTKILREEKGKIQVVINDDIEQFGYFLSDNEQLNNYFVYHDGKLSCVDMTTQLIQVRQIIKEINFKYADKIANKDSEIKPIFSGIADRNKYLRSYSERLFSRLERIDDNGKYISNGTKVKIIHMINEIERYEKFLSYFEDLIEMFDNKSFGFWESHSFIKKVDISSLNIKLGDSTIRYTPQTNPCLKDIINIEINKNQHLSLDLWIQYTLNSKNATDNNVYLKVILQNSSLYEEKDGKYFSIVTEDVNKLCLFGVKVDIGSDYLMPYHENGIYTNPNKEKDKLEFLYRSIEDYGVGHLCSVNWKKDDDGKVRHVFSEFIPSYETPDIEPEPRNKYAEYVNERGKLVPPPYLKDSRCLQFKRLSTISDVNDNVLRNSLLDFVDEYGKWINVISTKVSEKDKNFANINIEACRKDYNRMRSNVEKILSDKNNMLAFRLMNTAMFMQMWHNKNNSDLSKNCPCFNIDFYKNASDFIFQEGIHAAWRPFQLAFIILNLDGIVRHPDDKQWSKRNNIVDLVWFPTGGGKTEAYLGIIAMNIIVRRRNNGKRGYGVSTIMRYTLRLLTNQQFQRALCLILALEQIRLWNINNYNLGDEEISIGLYVGGDNLPNHIKSGRSKGLEEIATEWNNRENGHNETKIPLDICPWCGSRLEYCDNEFCCTNLDCTYNEGLPVRLCDEQIYKKPPTLLFGTVDKFASIAHRVSTSKSTDDSRRLFGKGKDYNVLPPDLIIQDELHLLLGPLGSAVSLFECAIDQLCTRKEDIDGKEVAIRPKIISSTATTRNTDLQIRALYDRDLNIFPKNGIDYDDSFFAFYKRVNEDGNIRFESKRKYIGIMPTGRTQMTTQMRLAAILFVHRALFELKHEDATDYEKAADNYFSSISYFNSLKEIGKTDAQFNIEYIKYLKRLFKRVLRVGNLMEWYYSSNLKESEISGRLSSGEINKTFKEVETVWKMQNRLPKTVTNNGETKWIKEILPPDYILATNMISVGLDVSRFNIIIMNSMPRNIAEYIQASSRVARSVPGLVLTLHNPFRSRDVSHFEKYREFHEKLYYYVEPISITPFSKKSVDKYFPLYMAALIRHSFLQLADNNSASQINKGNLKEQVHDKILSYIRERYNNTMHLPDELSLQKGLLTPELEKYIEEFVNKALNQWSSLATDQRLTYEANPFSSKSSHLYIAPDAYDDERNNSYWTVPTSLRIVEPEAVLHVKVK